MYEIAARIDHLSDGVGCFDPRQVVCRLRSVFPSLVELPSDPLWETYERIRASDQAGSAGALRIAVRDIQERGPKIMFEVPLRGGGSIRGTAERYWVLVTSPTEFPEEFRRCFTEVLGRLFFQPIQVSTGST